MLIHSANQLLTLAGSPQRGVDLGNLGIISNGCVLVRDGEISAVGTSPALMAKYPDEPQVDTSGKIVMPGFVDPHTHALWVGDRSAEFEMRIQGKSYLDILAAGGGILSTVRATRQASVEQMAAETRPRLKSMFAHGTTTAEIKSGYGLETRSELRMLDAIMLLNEEGPIELASTFLGAHAIAPEFIDNADGYTDVICSDMLPKLLSWSEELHPEKSKPFVDVFCETGAFSLEQSQRILTTANKLGFPLKIHADEFDNLGGASLAADLNATSADHLVATSPEDITRLAQILRDPLRTYQNLRMNIILIVHNSCLLVEQFCKLFLDHLLSLRAPFLLRARCVLSGPIQEPEPICY